MDSLKADLRSIQAVAKDLLNHLGGDLSLPSWKFPEKLAAHLDTDQVLKERERDEEGLGDNKLFIMELITDRLLLVLQCCVRLSDNASGHKSTTSPLTLGSAIKKFSRRIKQDHSTIRDTKERLSLKDNTISTLECSVSSLQDNVRQLQDTLHNRVPTVSFSSSPLSGQHSLETLQLSSANNSMLQGSSRGNALTQRSEESTQHWSTTTDNSSGDGEKQTSGGEAVFVSKGFVLETRSVHTQTTETAFALCVRCSDTQNTLVDIAQSVSAICSKHNQRSSLSETDWESLAKVEGLDIKKWSTCFESDLNCFDSYTCCLKETGEELMREQSNDREVIGKLKSEIDTLSSQIDSLQVSIDEVQRHSRDTLTKTQEELGVQLNELRQACSELQASNFRVKEELSSTKKQEALIKSRMMDLEQTKAELQRDLQSIQSREVHLLSTNQGLERDLETTVGEVGRWQGLLESNKLELSKTRVYSLSLEKKNKSLVAKQAAILSRLDDLDQECSDLKEELWKVNNDRGELSSEVAEIQAQCTRLQQQLESEKDKLSFSHEKHDQLSKVCSELEGQVSVAKKQLEEERERCRLLMDYPFIKQTAEGYVSHIASLSGRESQKQISANTVRILLLEEQNSELRHKRRQSAHKVNSATPQLRSPVQTWRNELVSQVTSEQSLAREVSSMTHTPTGFSTVGHFPDQVHQPYTSQYPKKTNERVHLSMRKAKSALQTTRSVEQSPRGYEQSPTRHYGSAKVVRMSSTASSRSDSRQPPPSRPPTGGSLKGRLGHLVAAIAESHRTSNITMTSPQQMSEKETPPPIRKDRQDVWIDLKQPLSSSDSSCISPTGSCSSLDIHMCSKCDRMYHNKQQLDKHLEECEI